MFNDSDINIVAANPHTHSRAIHMSTRIVRNGTMIGYLHWNKNYNSSYQTTYRIDPPIVVKNVYIDIEYI